MKYLKPAGIIVLICFAGELIVDLTHIPIPGNVIGMLLLFTLLCTGVIKPDQLESVSKPLLSNMAFFYIPAGVGLIACLHLLESNLAAFFVICILGTVIVMVTVALTVQLLRRVTRKSHGEEDPCD